MFLLLDGMIRLINDDSFSQSSGRVEIVIEGQWGTVCDNNWTFSDAQVVCRQLGFDGALAAYYLPGRGAILLDSVQCEGSENTLLDCGTTNTGVLCGHGRDVGVQCSNRDYFGRYLSISGALSWL